MSDLLFNPLRINLQRLLIEYGIWVRFKSNIVDLFLVYLMLPLFKNIMYFFYSGTCVSYKKEREKGMNK